MILNCFISSSSDIRRWQSYVEPGDEIDTGSPTKRISRSNLEPLNGDIDSEEMLTLPEGTLNRNLGLDLIVVVTKTDYMADLGKQNFLKDYLATLERCWFIMAEVTICVFSLEIS